jgi:hypothetical protein
MSERRRNAIINALKYLYNQDILGKDIYLELVAVVCKNMPPRDDAECRDRRTDGCPGKSCRRCCCRVEHPCFSLDNTDDT